MTRFLDKFRTNLPGNVPVLSPSDLNTIIPPARHEWGIADLTLDGIVLLDHKLLIVDANPRALGFLHTSLSAITGYSLWDVVSQEIASQHEHAVQPALADSDQYVFVAHESHANSWVEYTLRRCAAGYIVNLREAGPAQKYQRLLEDSKRYNQLIFEDNPNVMWVFDRISLQIFAANKAAIGFYGIPRKTFMTLGMEALFPEGEGAELLHSLNGGKQDQAEMRLCRQKKMDGKEVLVELAWSQVKWSGHEAGLVSLA